jgi:hypothetical protein
MEVTCIDDKNRPNEIPTSHWVKKKQTYTIRKIMLMKQQGGIAGVKLEEINNDAYFPWTYFRLDRFGLTKEQIEKMIQSKEVEVEYV